MNTVDWREKGKKEGHCLRRLFHLSSIFIPFFYYQYSSFYSNYVLLPAPSNILLILLILIFLLESLRLRYGWVVIGQRSYEKTQISGFTWGFSFSFLTLLIAKSPAIAFAIIGSYAIVDPLIGEMRRLSCSFLSQYFSGWMVVTVIWLIATVIGHLSIWCAIIIPPFTIAAEKAWLAWLDDNALTQLVPLIISQFL